MKHMFHLQLSSTRASHHKKGREAMDGEKESKGLVILGRFSCMCWVSILWKGLYLL